MTPGIILDDDQRSRPVGKLLRTCSFITVCCTFDLVSTVGEVSATTTVSSTPPNSSTVSMVATKPALTLIPWQGPPVLKPVSSNFRS